MVLSVVASCATYEKIKPLITPYRATIGISVQSAQFESNDQQVCVSEVPNIKDSDECSSGGFKSFNGEPYIDPWIEFKPNYFGESSFGWSYFLRYDSIKTALVNYPNTNENTDIRVRKIGLNPYVYYNWGQRFQDNKGFSFRFGAGASLGYFWDVDLTRQITGETYSDDGSFGIGFSAFVELNWYWFVLRISHSRHNFDEQKFGGMTADDLSLQSNKVSLLYAYYF